MDIAIILCMISTNEMLGNSLAYMDSLWKRGKSGGGQSGGVGESLSPNMPFIPKSAQLQPDWERIPSKNVAMSDEEFEEAIKNLALENAERGVKKGDVALLMEYISVVSPDRKEAYEMFNGRGDAVYGNYNQELMTRSSNGTWNCGKLTNEEMARYSKFNEIYLNTIKEYEAEHGKIQHTEAVKAVYNSYSSWAASQNSYPSLYNMLA